MHRIGTAGWSLPASVGEQGTRLYRYARRLRCVEINSTFYRPHRAATWARWSAETPDDFRFSIKAPKTITHESKLRGTEDLVKAFFEQIEAIGEKVGPILFQLPPSLGFEIAPAEDFLGAIRTLYEKEVALEPRHASWLSSSADELLTRHRIARVAADPPKGSEQAAEPGGDTSLVYYRLHGSPRTYYSNYEEEFLTSVASRIESEQNAWIIFDNTALSYAYDNALSLQKLVAR